MNPKFELIPPSNFPVILKNLDALQFVLQLRKMNSTLGVQNFKSG